MSFAGSDRSSSYRNLLGNRPFRLWFASALASSLGDWLGLFALQVLVVSLAAPGSRVALFGLGGIMMARLLPSIVFGPAAGVVADRVDRKRLMVTSDLVRAGLFAVIAFTRNIWLLLGLVLLVECFTILYIAAKNAVLPAIVDRGDLTEANQLTMLVTYGPLPFGAAIAAMMTWVAGLLGRMGLEGIDPTVAALVLNAATFLVAGWLISRMPLDRQERGVDADEVDEPEGDIGPVRQLVEGLRFIADRQIIRSLIVGVVGVFFGAGMIVALGPELVRSELGRAEDAWYGLMTTVGVGLLAGMAASTWLAGRVSKERLFPAALVPTSVLVIVVGFLPGFRLSLIAGFALGVAAGTSFVIGFTMLHERTPDAVRGRTFATFYTAARISMFAALAIAPFVAGAIGSGEIRLAGLGLPYSGIRITIVVGGALALASALPAGIGMIRGVHGEEHGRRAGNRGG